VRLLVVSDIHDKIGNLISILKKETFDAVIVSGDFTYFKPMAKVLIYMEKIRGATEAPVYFVPGNCDPPELLDLSIEEKKFFNLHKKVITIGDYQIAGIGGGGISPFNTNIEFTEEQFSELIEEIKAQLSPSKPLILVTHLPPYETVDFLRHGTPIGSKAIRRFVEEASPIVVFSGHVHESRGIKQINKTVVVNPGPAQYGNYSVCIIEKNNVFVELRNKNQD